ncbi:uncharacterized protein SPAPADRAFT_67014 [Spathaspora passalidarum NRRL Y-27907]|uniref:Bul1 N-terminal domain-containing protein n=1 Tax=Spathaspora passalidarum (strain NRRL Y-27907 / 11-Y1) TaxID=619300 RepID=G3AMY0_SPAPN|nr:uncharacterized protein SPAPADRAFT_67014 [Spathaspora passalidarum NRRL Y-27907]EGW32394.1 hypothetical protein SPAPADRAFT_67014 [Spathaspora passalidarum NRRL Y-27907]
MCAPAYDCKQFNRPDFQDPYYCDDDDDDDVQSILSIPEESNVLPSYYMYKSVVHNKFKYLSGPPSYSSLHDESSDLMQNSNPSTVSVATSISSTLQSLTSTNKISLEVRFDQPSNHDYKQGETISGHLILQNTCDSPINFSTIYILLEGSISFAETKAKTFLSMVDFDSVICPLLHIDANSIHKHPFTFRIPNYLLDSECAHVSNHLEIPPTTHYTMFCNAEVKYNLSGYILRQENCEYVNVGEIQKEVSIIPQYTNEEHINTNYESLLSKLLDETIYINKDRFNQIMCNLRITPLQNKQVITGNSKVSSVKFDANLLQGLKVKYVPAIPGHPDLNQTLSIPIEFKSTKGGEAPSIKSISAELVAATGKTYASCPVYIDDSMLFESFSNRKYNDIVVNPIIKMKGELYRLSHELDNSGLKKLLRFHIYYSNFAIPKVEYSNKEIKVNLKGMYRSLGDKSRTRNVYGGFNLTPNFQSCHMVRSYYLHLVVKFDWKSKNNVVINIPVKVGRY